MRFGRPDRTHLRDLFRAEKRRFVVLDEQKISAWKANDLALHESIKVKWRDSAEELAHLHRQLYKYFPRGGTCGYCGCDMIPVLGMSKTLMRQCIACERIESE